ncbi:MAG: hypothetical protein DCC43_10735 [Candidatus Brocadia sp.]|nr:hypothetical protein [Anaerolineales bacterium]MCC6326739.1 DUF4823 domain-containing protein [Candidatus Brocadia sp.]MCE7912464.1 DUF4823 domain-containing protein [Candidatus Brocadia sp. AMX3]MDG5997960.1 DUF4823 domain-containing protein [Candidatus Brocadia sp.]RIJ96967.1 MAG: hypothetical protein DCC43_10735 [Candidatus Brocadia sp.]
MRLKIFSLFLFVIFIAGCASLKANRDMGMKISKAENKIMVFPFRNPYYKGKELEGVGDTFAISLVSEIQSTGRTCELAEGDFKANKSITVDDACTYARQKGAGIAVTGVVTEWLDGATQWSGTVDVAAIAVNAYDTENCKLISSVSGRQNGQWFTFVNAPATRFMRPLSQEIVKALFE